MTRDELFDAISTLVMCHSPSGAETEIDAVLLDAFRSAGAEAMQDGAGNIIAKFAGWDATRSIAITAHKDEIGAIVKNVKFDGCVEVRKLGGAFPWVYGEGVVDLLGDARTVSGVLSFGSRHVSHESPQKSHQSDAPLLWENAWIDTKLSYEALREAGVRPGTRMVVGKHRKRPFRLGHHIASYALDNKASLAVLLGLAKRLETPVHDTYLVATANEELGAIGAMYFTRTKRLDALIALEICPKSEEYPIESEVAPVLLSQDGYGVYDEILNRRIADVAHKRQIPLQRAILSGFGSDASIAMKNGHVPSAACLGFPTDNTHGYEIAHIDALRNLLEILTAICAAPLFDRPAP